MKKFKKIAALLLAMVMALAMAVPAMADTLPVATKSEDGIAKIVVNGLTDGENTTVKVYKVVTLSTDGNSWVIADGVTASAVDLTKNPVEVNLDSLTPTDTAKVTEQTVSGTTVTFTGLEMGVYLVTAVDENQTQVYKNMLAVTYVYDEDTNLMEEATSTVAAKASTNQTTKEIVDGEEDGVYEVGKTINYKITAVVPGKNVTNEFYVTDTLTGASVNTNSFSVKIGNTEYYADTMYIAGTESDGYTFKLSLDSLITDANEGQTVTITYSATVTDALLVKNLANASNNPDSPDPVYVYTGTLTVKKVDSTDNTKTLKGAKFKIFKVEDGVVKYATFGDNNYFDAWVNSADSATELETGDNGTLTVYGLDAGTYYAVETLAPKGYQLANPYEEETTETAYAATVTVSKNDNTDPEAVTVTGEGTATDTKLNSLPSTGGIGTTIFTVVGCMIMIAAGGMLIVSRRRKNA